MKFIYSLPIVLTLIASVHSHGFIGLPSREKEKFPYPGSNEAGFPFKTDVGGGTLRGGGSCLTMPPMKSKHKLPTGDYDVPLQFNDGANHVGLCQIFLTGPTGTPKELIGEQKDCARSSTAEAKSSIYSSRGLILVFLRID